MTQVVATLDDLGRPAWIAVMVAGFILFWPIGLAILAYLLWSGRMGRWKHARGCWGRWHHHTDGDAPRRAARSEEHTSELQSHNAIS